MRGAATPPSPKSSSAIALSWAPAVRRVQLGRPHINAERSQLEPPRRETAVTARQRQHDVPRGGARVPRRSGRGERETRASRRDSMMGREVPAPAVSAVGPTGHAKPRNREQHDADRLRRSTWSKRCCSRSRPRTVRPVRGRAEWSPVPTVARPSQPRAPIFARPCWVGGKAEAGSSADSIAAAQRRQWPALTGYSPSRNLAACGGARILVPRG
jgi:hypothetical protein